MEVKLEDLMKAKTGIASADVTPDNLPSAEVMTAQVEKVVNDLNPEERAQVDKIKDELDLTDSTAILRFGAPAQQKIAEFSDSVLSQVRTKDSGPVGELLGNLVTQVREFEPEGGSSFLKKIPLVGSLVKKGEDIKQGYEKLSTQVERIQTNLEQAKLKMMKDVALFDKLYAENLSYFKQLQLYIQAGEEKLTEMREVTLPKLRQQAADSGDPMAVQVVADFEASVNRFEKKVHDLKISKTIAIQSAPQIRLIQNNDKALIDRVQTAIYSRMQQAVNNTTNELLRRNAELLQQNSIETAQENERSIVDIETVREVNDRLINTIEETIKIQQNGRAKRQAAEAELVQIEGRLRETLLKNSGRQGAQ